jgi:hypothetical protein
MKPVLSRTARAHVLTALIVLIASLADAKAHAPSRVTQRIRFAPGATSATVRGFLSKRRPSVSYIVRTRAGQRMSIKVTPVENPSGIVPLLDVVSPSGHSSAADRPKARRFNTQNTEAGDYRIRVGTNLMASNGSSGAFRLKIWIR